MQCSILIVSDEGRDVADRKALQRAGFLVEETRDWPADGAVERFHVLLVEFSPVARACMIATRLRAKRGVGRRVLVASVPEATPQDRRCAIDAGFDAVLDAACTPRQQVASILRCLRARPEFRCVLPARADAA